MKRAVFAVVLAALGLTVFSEIQNDTVYKEEAVLACCPDIPMPDCMPDCPQPPSASDRRR